MHFMSFIFDNNLYMFQIGKLFIIRRLSYMQHLVCTMHSFRLAAITFSVCHICMYVYVCIYMCMWVCVHTYIHTYTHTQNRFFPDQLT